MRHTRPYGTLFWGGIALTILLGAVGTSRPILIKYTIEEFVVKPNPQGLLNYTLLMVALLLLESLFQFAFSYTANTLGQNVIRDIRSHLFARLVRFRMGFFDKTPIGTLVTRAISDIEAIANIFSEGLLVIFGDLFKIAVMVGAMFFFFDARLVLISLSVVPLLYIATRWFQVSIKDSFQDVRNEVARLNTFVQEHLSGMSVVHLFNREKVEMDAFKSINRDHRDANIRSIWYFSIFLPIIEVLSAVSIGLVVWFGGLWAAAGDSVTFGDLTALIIFINMLFRPLRQLADRFNTLQMGMVASERVFKLLDLEERIEDQGTLDPASIRGEIGFDKVVFGYDPEHPVLHGVSFSVRQGENIAIVGATGAGKSTIIQLIGRFYPIQQGQITLDGVPLEQYSLSGLRRHLAVVQQDVFLFSDSIAANVRLGADWPMEELEKAAELIGLSDFIAELPGGWDYNVRERGGMLSSGQRQLLAFLRAYVRNPAVLILDEATSSVDTHTEHYIQVATERLTQGRTSIVIAHRLATIRKADRILVMDQGRIVEEGTHEELLERNGMYRNLYEMQFAKQEV
ncbi:ATP-binding cassette domain-containing protein [bacterium]|nr:ATP-binding cassette domain-containing protein [bacterium]